MSKIAAFARQWFGVELRPGQAEVLGEFERGGYQQAVWQCGRRSGKSMLADVLVLYDALVRESWLRKHLRLGELRVCGILSPTQEQSRKHIRNIDSMLQRNPKIDATVVRRTMDEIEFANGAVIKSYPNSARGFRGDPCSSVVLDEFGHFLTVEDGNNTGEAVYAAVRPSVAQFGNDGWLLAISTPLWRQGMFWQLVDRAASGKYPYIHYVKRPTSEMNPTPEILAEAEKVRNEDPDQYYREFLAEFIDGLSSYLSAVDVEGCRREENILGPQPGFRYLAAIDPAYQHDNFACCIGHREDRMIVIDGVWVWKRQGHDFTMGEIARLCQAYGVTEIRTDQHAPIPIREALEKHRLIVNYVPWTNESKNEAMNRLKVNTNTRMVQLPNDDALISELLSLEAKPTQGGLTRIAAAKGAYDDRAIAVASVVQALDKPNDVVAIFAAADEEWERAYRGVPTDADGDQAWPTNWVA